jgi:2-dehydro-3-deoxygluconokinase
VSLDLNYREKLWRARGGPERARAVMRRLAEGADVLVGNEEDLQLSLGIRGPDAARDDPLEPEAFVAMAEQVAADFPNVRLVAATMRQVLSASRHRWSALAWTHDEVQLAPTLELDVLDRVGGGDGFAAGLFAGLLGGERLDVAVRLGWAHGALLTTYPGDTSMATVDQVRALAGGVSSRIQR